MADPDPLSEPELATIQRYWWDELGMQPADMGGVPRPTDYVLWSDVLATIRSLQQRNEELQATIERMTPRIVKAVPRRIRFDADLEPVDAD